MVEIDEKKAEYWLKKAEESPRGQRAFELFKEGYNCSQAVVLAFADLIGMDEKLLTRVTSSFGGGMGRLRLVCGAVSGMQQEKAAHYERIQELAGEYRAVNGSIVCRELLGLATSGADQPTPELRTAEYYKKRPCGQLVMLAATILESYIKEHPTDRQDL